jgi:hypothetical protein
MIAPTNTFDGVMTMVCQGSRALNAQAEKAEWSSISIKCRTTYGHPSNLDKYRLDGWNPHGYWLRQPPNLANLHAHTRTRTHARIRARANDVLHFSYPIKLENRLGWLGGWQSQYPCGFQPSNLPTNLS